MTATPTPTLLLYSDVRSEPSELSPDFRGEFPGDFHNELQASRVYARTRQNRSRSSPTPSTFADFDTLDGISGESITLLNSKGSTQSTTSTVLQTPSLGGLTHSTLSLTTAFSATARRRPRRNSFSLLPVLRDPAAPSATSNILPFSAQRVAPRQPNPRFSIPLPPPSHTSRRDQLRLIRACATGSLVTVTALVAAGTDPNSRDQPTSWSERGAAALHVATMAGHRDIVRELLRRGARVDEPFRGWRRALHESCRRGDAPLTRVLLEHAAPVDSRDESGYTPLHVAVMNERVACAHLLVGAGAAVDAMANDFLTPLHHVAMQSGNEELTALLLEAGADTRVRTRWLLGNKLAREIARERGYEMMERRLRFAEGAEPLGEQWLRDLRRERE